jgi:putative transcriptional regulator
VYLKNKVREYRLKKGMTQQQLADAVHVSTRTIISLEQGRYNPSIMLAYRLAVEFGTTIEDLYCLEENKKEEDKRYENKK